MLLEQQMAGQGQDGEQAFPNEDGTPATWLEVIPERTRRKAFAWRAGIGLIFTVALWTLVGMNGTLDVSAVLFCMLPLGFGLLFGGLKYLKRDVRRYSVAYVSYTPRERLKRASKWWLCGVVLLAVAWGSLIAQGLFAQQWWYASPVVLIFLVGLGLYRLKGEVTLTPAAAKAKAAQQEHLERERKAQAVDPPPPAPNTGEDSPLIRYPLAVVFAYGAYYLGAEATIKHAGWYSAACIFAALCFARELTGFVLVLAVVGGIVWVVIAGIAALPVSLAIIVGALIIASASKK